MAADYGIVRTPQTLLWTSPAETIVRASNLEQSDYFGISVAISGNYAIVGAQYEDGAANGTNDCGAAYIFERNTSTGVWSQTQILRASNLGASDEFGNSVAIDGNYAIVGAHTEDGAANGTAQSGAAYIFERNGSGVWNETQILRADNLGADDNFGKSVAISGNYVIVGAHNEDGAANGTSSSGAAYIFERNTSTGVWSQTSLLRADNLGAGDQFGISVAIDGNYAIVGASSEDGAANGTSSSGAAYIFERNTSTGVWSQTSLLRASNLDGGDFFGETVSISGNYAIVGANGEDGAANGTAQSGAAYIFERNGSGNWIEQTILRASNLKTNNNFGYSVSIDGNYAIVGAYQEDGSSTSTAFNCGAAYIFERNTSTGVWSEQKILRASNFSKDDSFGNSVAISGDYAIVGAYGQDGTSGTTFESGAAYIYQASIVLDPTPISFVNNTVTLTNSIDSTDMDKVSFELTSGNSMYPFSVTSFSGTGTITYTLDISGGANVKTGTFSANNVDLLAGTPVTASGNTTYIFTLTANAEITYTIFGSILTAPSNIILSNNSVNELRPIGFTIGTLTCDNPNNSFIAYSVSDTTNFSITGSTLKTNAVFDYETNASYPITITSSIGGLTETGSFTISVTNVANEALELRNQNTQGSALYIAANSQTPPISVTDLKAVGYTATELKAAGYTATELTAAAYTITELKTGGYNVYEMIAAGYTAQQLYDIGYYGTDLSANRFNASYMEGYLDISGGNVTVRGSSRNLNMASGNAVFSGTTTFTQPYIYNNDISLNNRLFVIGDVSMGSGNANITGNLSINGTLSAGSYNTGTIALNAIYPAFASNTSYSQKIQMNGDVSMNGNAQFSSSTTLRIGNQIRFSDGTIIRTTNKETNGTTFKASTFNNMTVVGDFASTPVLTPSDYRIKTNVQSLDETHILDNLRPVKYYQTQSERNDIGFLAHELQEYYPDLVDGEMDGEQMQSVNYNGILAILINEVQRLKQNIKRAKAVIAAKKVSA
jgi:hypothetical protein